MVEIVAQDQRFATLICFNAGIGRNEERGFEIQRAWANIRASYPDIHIAISGAMTSAVRAAYEAIGCLTYAEPDLAVRIAAAMAQCERRRNAPPAVAPAPGVRQELPPGTLNEVRSAEILRAAGIPVVDARLATVRDEALAAAREIGFPVVVKIVAADILHKSDIGAVVLNVTDEAAVAAAWERCMDAARQHMP
jgi:acyl-CoA synthetase (NDP forming)